MITFGLNFSAIQLDKLELSQPGWLWLIPAYILVYIILNIGKKKYPMFEKCESAGLASLATKSQPCFFHPLAHLVKNQNRSKQITSNRKYLYFIIFTLLILALSQPVYVGKKLPEPPQQRDIVFIIDTSVSMILRDYILQGERIDRMSLLKAVLDNFIQRFPGERMSMIVFGDTAYTLVPLTSDQMLLRNMLRRIQATMAGRFNAMGEAIALAVNQAQTADTGEAGKSMRKRVLVLLTDSDQPTGRIDPLVAAQLAKQNGLPIYTVAIGATNPEAEEIRRGGLLYAPVDLELLAKISKITGAKSYHAIDTRALSQAINDISTHESNKAKVKPVYYRQNFYFWFLITAMLLFFLVQVIETFKQKKSQERTA